MKNKRTLKPVSLMFAKLLKETIEKELKLFIRLNCKEENNHGTFGSV
jgi:hypothetical protein